MVGLYTYDIILLRDSLHELLQDICKDVKLERMLLPVTNEELPAGSNVTDGARAGVSSVGFWNPLSRTFFDIRVFNPLAKTNWNKESSSMYKDYEKGKKKRVILNRIDNYCTHSRQIFSSLDQMVPTMARTKLPSFSIS